MRRGDRAGQIAKPSNEEFRTPNRPPTAAASSSALDRSKGPSSSRRRSGTPASSVSSLRSSRRDAVPNARGQPTLTQIDFVTPVSQNLPSDDNLDYIDEGPRNPTPKPRDVIKVDDYSDDADYRPPSHRQARRDRGVRFEEGPTSSSHKKTSRGGDGESKPGRRKSGDGVKGNKKDKNNQKERNKTLTQMEYVRRYLKVESDEDVKLDYTYITPKKEEERKPNLKHSPSAEELTPSPNTVQESSSERKRRRLNDGLDSKDKLQPAKNDERKPLDKDPVTPQKSRKFEIPSSQSPESPGLAFISSSQFRSAMRSPLKRVSSSAANLRIKEESPDYDQAAEDTQSPQQTTLPSEDASPPAIASSPSLSQNRIPTGRPVVDVMNTQFGSENEPFACEEGNKIRNDADQCPTSTARTVVYETDAESDYGDFQDDLSSAPGSPQKQKPASDHHSVDEEYEDTMSNDGSQELPPVMPYGQDSELGLLHSENTTLPSDASICYQRLQQHTQYPLEPIPILNTQKMAELFPEDSNPHLEQLEPTSEPQSIPTAKSCTLPTNPFQTETQSQTQSQTQTQTQSQSQERDKTSTEIVPESSPIARQDNDSSIHNVMRHRPHIQEAVVQVESSQPVDRLHKQASREQNSYPGRILSEGQFLTSSVMESVPMPAFWLGSQDSVGEPYDLPEA